MIRLLAIMFLVICGNLPSFSQDNQDIEITWLNAPSETKDNLLTLKWGIITNYQCRNFRQLCIPKGHQCRLK